MELVLNTFGTALSRDNEGFVILSKDCKQRIPAEGIRLIAMRDSVMKRNNQILYSNRIRTNLCHVKEQQDK